MADDQKRINDIRKWYGETGLISSHDFTWLREKAEFSIKLGHTLNVSTDIISKQESEIKSLRKPSENNLPNINGRGTSPVK